MTDAEKALIEINSRLGSIERGVGGLEKYIFGNGQPGMATRFERLETNCNACIDGKKTRMAIMIACISAIAAAVDFFAKKFLNL
jgi:hypothetical protein